MTAPPTSRDPARVPWRALALVVIVAIVFRRNADAFLYPVLFGEDGTRLFMFYQENRGFDSLLREYAGYVSFAANLMGWLIGALPLVAQPYVLAANAGVVAALCFWLFTSDRFGDVLGDARLRCGVAVGLALLPVGNFALSTCTMFVNWHLLLAATFLALARAPRTVPGRITEGLFVWLCLWTNPVSICLVPIYGWRIWQAGNRVDRWFYGGLAGAAVLYQVLFVGGAGGQSPPLGGVASATGTLLTERVFTEPLLGTTGRFYLAASALPLAMLWPAAIVGMLLAWRWRHVPREARPTLLAAGALVFGMTLAVAYARFDDVPGMLQWGHRYTYLQKLLVYLVVAVTLFHGCRRPVVLFAILVMHGTVLSVFDRRAYETSRTNGEQLMRFVRESAAWRENPSAPGTSRVFRDARREITIRKSAGTPAAPR